MIVNYSSSLIQLKHVLKKTRFNIVLFMLSMSLCFAFILSALNLTRYYNHHAEELLQHIQAVIFLNSSANTSDVTSLKNQLSHQSNITNIKLIPKDEGLAQLRQDPNLTDILTHLNNNPVPDALIVTLSTSNGRELHQLLQDWQKSPIIHKVNIDLPWVERTLHTRDFINRLSTVFVSVMGLLLVVLLISSIRHYHINSREEQFIAQCFGATAKDIFLPLLEIVLLESLVVIVVGLIVSLTILKGLSHGLKALFFSTLSFNTLHFNYTLFLTCSATLFSITTLMTFIVIYSAPTQTHMIKRR